MTSGKALVIEDNEMNVTLSFPKAAGGMGNRDLTTAPIGMMAGVIAHEIRNPLSVCASAARFLMEGNVDEGLRRECARKIQRNVKRVSAIVEDLLELARPAGDLLKERVDLAPMVKEAVRLAQEQSPVEETEIVAQYPGKPVFTNGNRDLLRQVVLNLCLNGLQAMSSGDLLHIRCGQEGRDALIIVRDTGCGMSPADMDRIFEPSFTRSTTGRGTGLGLFLCHSIVKRHGGGIHVQSTEGVGSTFTVRLPLYAPETDNLK